MKDKSGDGLLVRSIIFILINMALPIACVSLY